MRLCGLVLCKRILLALLLDKVSRGTGRLPWVPLPASPPFCFRSTNPPKQNGGQVMTTINLKNFYYWYIVDELVEVPDEVAEVLLASRRNEAAYQRRLTRNKAFYSLDCDDGIEYSACLHEPSPQELLDRKELFFRLWNALNSLPEIQGRRVDAHLILGKSYRQIAREEGVDKSAVRCSVESGIKRMKKYLRENF